MRFDFKTESEGNLLQLGVTRGSRFKAVVPVPAW